MVSVAINHGSGPVDNATVELAEDNIRHLIADVGLEGTTFERDESHDYGDGRFCFILRNGEFTSEVQMPGIPLPRVRYMGAPQNIWHFPRLYVSGSSWVWLYAINSVRRDLQGGEQDDE